MSNGRLVANGLALDLSVVDSDQITTRMRRVLEAFLLERGEAFVASLTSGQAMMFVEEELEGLVERDLASHPDATSLRGSVVPLVAQTLHRVLLSPSEQVRTYLRAVADGYTLFAFLRETPNVQSAVSKLFANGEIWLDTSALLPVMAEDLLEEAERGYSQLLHAVVTSGGKLYVTSGVLEEISSHIDNSIAASRSPKTWNSRTPFLLASYTWAGHAATGFSSWVETFRGQSRPIDDLEEYLAEVHGIRLVDLIADYQRADENVRWQTDAHWQEVHERRRSRTSEQRADPDVIRQLAAHDAENFLGVIQRRSGEQIGNPFGYSTWWLTLDRRAAEAASAIAERCQLERLDSPVLSFDFLAYYLAVGPARRQLAKSSEQQLPLITDTSLIDALPADLLSAADRIRASMEGQDERLIRRRIRDHLDEEKLRDDRVGRTTIDAIEFDIRMALQSSPSRGRRVGS